MTMVPWRRPREAAQSRGPATADTTVQLLFDGQIVYTAAGSRDGTKPCADVHGQFTIRACWRL